MLLQKHKKVISRAKELVRYWRKRKPGCDGQLKARIIRLERAVAAAFEEFR